MKLNNLFFSIRILVSNHLCRPIFACLFTSLLVLMTGCGGEVDGGEQTIFESPNALPLGIALRVNNLTGSDSADGVSQPFQSLQHALDTLRPGDTLIIENTDTSYSSNAVIGEEFDAEGNVSRVLQGFALRNSGSPNLPIIIQGERSIVGDQPLPVIDQLQSTSTPGVAILGIYLPCVSHIVIRDLEIRNTNEAGISSSTNGACDSSGITIENSHIHSVYGEKYVGGIRMMGVSDLLIRNNTIENIFSNSSPEQKLFVKNGRGQSNIVVESNHFEDLEVGVSINAQSLSDASIAVDQGLSITDIKIANNTFNQLTGSAIVLQTHISDALNSNQENTGSFLQTDIYGNVFDQVESALIVDTNPSLQQSNDLCFYNNTLVDNALAALNINSVSDLEFFNNLIYRPLGDIIMTRAAINESLQNRLSYSDNNLFALATPSWHLDIGGPTETLYSDFQSWMNASHPELSIAPDIASYFGEDPAFVDADNANYTLQPSSPALSAGRFGLSIGADFDTADISAPNASSCVARLLEAQL